MRLTEEQSKQIAGALFILAVMLLLSGCYTDKEFARDMAQIKAQSAHPSTYQLVDMKGPMTVTLDKGSDVKVNVPNQPWQHVKYPSQLEVQADTLKTIGVLGLSAYGINRLSHEHESNAKTTTTTTTEGAK